MFLTEKQLNKLYEIMEEHKNAIDEAITKYQRNFISYSQFSDIICRLQAEYDRKAEPFIQTAEIIANAEKINCGKN